MAEPIDPRLLAAVLDHRERRWQQRMALSRQCDTLVSLTLCLPLRYRGREEWKAFLRRQSAEIEKRLSAAGFPVTGRDESDGADGLCLFLLSRGGTELKKACVALEEELPGGRFLDIDVTGDEPVSRRDLGLPPRRCFVCGEPAADCVAMRRHSAKEIDRAIEDALSMMEI